jgi:hypothetical protein
MPPVWNLLLLTFGFVCIILLHFTDFAVSVLTEGSGPIYSSMLMTSEPKLRSTASSSTCFDRSITKLRSTSHVWRWSIRINVTICWRHCTSYCQRSRVSIRVVDSSCQRTGSNHCVSVTESEFGYDDNKKRDFVVPKINVRIKTSQRLCRFEFKYFDLVCRCSASVFDGCEVLKYGSSSCTANLIH